MAPLIRPALTHRMPVVYGTRAAIANSFKGIRSLFFIARMVPRTTFRSKTLVTRSFGVKIRYQVPYFA